MAQQKRLYGMIAILIALLIIVSSLSAYFAFEYFQVSQSNKTYVQELKIAQGKYNQTASEYNLLVERYDQELQAYNQSLDSLKSLVSTYDQVSTAFLQLTSEYNQTFQMLVGTLSITNTSSQEYITSSHTLPTLWRQYLNLVRNYQTASADYNRTIANLENRLDQSRSNLTIPNNFTIIEPIQVSLFTADFLIDFGNGTTVWYNDTQIQPGWNLYVATLIITNGNLNATWYPQYQEHYVTGIDGVQNTETQFWFLWNYNSTQSGWQIPQTGADQLTVYNGSSYAWTFCGMNSSYQPTCHPP